MKRIIQRLLACALLSFTASMSAGNKFEGLLLPQNLDLGDITSDGSGGRQIQVRPVALDDIGSWHFFPPHVQFPESYPAPTPATPSQSDILLTASTPLLLVLPQLAHFPNGAQVSVTHSIDGYQINVDASSHLLGYATATIYGPHEYLHPLGPLDPGKYQLNLNLTMSWNSTPSTLTGYIDFFVHPVPEPSTFTVAVICVGQCALFSRRVRRSNIRPR